MTQIYEADELYPNRFGKLNIPLHVLVGDTLNMTYTQGLTHLERSYDVITDCIVFGIAIQGPVIKRQNGHRLATDKELVLVENRPPENLSMSMLETALEQASVPTRKCPDCNGTGDYIGFDKVEPCARCLGTKVIS